MSGQAPLSAVIEATIDAAALAVDSGGAFVEAPFPATVTAVAVIADAAMAGTALPDSRHIQLVKGDGTVVASKAFVAGVNAAADVETALNLSAVAGATTVAQGDILEFESVHDGLGLAAPKFKGRVTFSRL